MATDVKKLVADMTLEEKAGLCGGADFWHTRAVERLGIPQFMMSDGPHGLRKQEEKADHLSINESIKAVCFPAACATASSFDTGLIQRMGETIGDECQAENLAIVLGPAVNIKRSPLCGRNFEYFSEDPYLAGEMAAAFINGVQSRDVGTSIKHFAANNQEYFRMSNDSSVSERALREIYLPAFETAVKKAQPWTVMCSYNKINGTYASDNEWLLSKVLRDDWGFEGFVMTDWGAVDDRVQGIRAGLELEMPGPAIVNTQRIIDAVQSGELDEKLLDRACERILKVVCRFAEHRRSCVFDREADHKKAEEIEAECAVLLQNNGVLPLKAGAKVAFIGEFAEKPRYQGGGSSHINAARITSALEAAKASGRNIEYVKGFPADRDESDLAELERAVAAARAADVAVIFAGLPDSFESEGYDRQNMDMPACQNALIAAVAAAQPNTVVVLHNGSPIALPWADSVAAILEMYLGGEGVGAATDALLYGDAVPSGHLAESFPLRLQDNPSYLNFNTDPRVCRYAEDVFVGYRYYEKKEMPVRFPFGHGLSYTRFEIANARLSQPELDDNGCVQVTVDVTNTGDRAGKCVTQLYVSDLNGTPDRPVKELKGFAKTELQPGETKQVSFSVDKRALSFYSEALGDWFAPSGKYALLIGDSSAHITACAELSFKTCAHLPVVVDGSATIGELMADERTAAVLRDAMSKLNNNSPFGLESTDPMMQAMMRFMPLKSLISFGALTSEQLDGLLQALRAVVK